MAEATAGDPVPIVALVFDLKTWGLALQINVVVAFVALVIVGVSVLFWRCWIRSKVADYELDEGSLGIGSATIKIKPNHTDRQVAYQIWVELSTRKIGLEIDPDHDVIDEIYDSWHAFFGVTRELVKSVPVNKATNPSTKEIIDISIALLNLGLRPHLTRWQARFRRWYKRAMESAEEEPQAIQRKFPEYEALIVDMLAVNGKLGAYRTAMHQLVYGSATKAREALEAAEDAVGHPAGVSPIPTGTTADLGGE
jgi:hypothetical protein